jgi:hypothetical protein
MDVVITGFKCVFGTWLFCVKLVTLLLRFSYLGSKFATVNLLVADQSGCAV